MNEENGAKPRSPPFSYPAEIGAGAEITDEVAPDLGQQRLELAVPAVLLGIELRLALDHPADVADPVRSYLHFGRHDIGSAEKARDSVQRAAQLADVLLRETFGQPRDILIGRSLQRGERGPAGGCERQDAPAAVDRIGMYLRQPVSGELPE